jgi:hypothetical protein
MVRSQRYETQTTDHHHPSLPPCIPIGALPAKCRQAKSALDVANLIGVAVGAGLFWLLTNRWLKNLYRSALVSSAFFLLFFSFGHILPAIGN